MKSDRPSRTWPYIGLLLCLFALSVTAPRSWREAALRYRERLDATAQPNAKSAESSLAEVANPAASGAADNLAEEGQGASDQATSEHTLAFPTVDSYTPDMPEDAEVAAEPVDAAVDASPLANSSESEVISDSPAAETVVLGSSEDRLAMRPGAKLFRGQGLPPERPEGTPTENDFEPAAAIEEENIEEPTDSELPTATVPPNLLQPHAHSVLKSGPQLIDNPASSEAEGVLEDVAIENESEAPESGILESQPESPVELGLPPANEELVEEPAVEETIELAVPSPPQRAQPFSADAAPRNSTPIQDVPAVDQLAWAMPETLLEQMGQLEETPMVNAWVADTRELLSQLCALPLPPVEARAELLEELARGLKLMERMAANEKEWSVKAKMLRVQYALSRRLEVWQSIQPLGATTQTEVLPDNHANPRLMRRISEFSSLTHGRRDGAAWRKNLQLDALQREMTKEGETAQRRKLAHNILSRVEEARSNPQQQAVANSEQARRLDSALRDWSAESVDLCRLLTNLESYESNHSPYMARQLAEQRQSLIWSPNAEDHEIGEQLERHYRNANVRLAVSEELLNRFLPKPQVFEASVDDTIAGASVSGYSRTLNRLQLRLIPDPTKIRLGLEAHGVVHSNTGSSSGPVTIYSRGESSYVARKLLLVSDNGMHIWPAVSTASAASDTHGMETDYDAIPVLRSFVRKMAETQQEELYGEAMAEVEARVRETTRLRLDKEADPRIREFSKIYENKVQGPLDRLDLKPTPISMSTTQDRAIIRFRVAGDNQLGAHTPRPCAPSDSLASIQVHESVLNNVADQLSLNGQTFTLPELHRMVAEKLGLTIAEPDDLPVDAHVTFADKDAVVIRCDDGKIWVTLSVAELSQGRRTFKNFKATAVYHLISQGLHTELERDGVVQLQGQRLSLGEQIALRGITAKLFSQNRRPQVISPERAKDPRLSGLRVSQLVVVDGWIGLAIAPDRVVRGPRPISTSATR